ncbi:MAG TPA: hypothetical protein PK431_03955 [Chitinophagales bacterium]|nr:hypothetical protein [Chitinophagales bacterium]
MNKILLNLLAVAFISAYSFGQTPTDNWKTSYDFDGDKKNDSVEVSFSGGGHCCYAISITLTSTQQKYIVPFELDGGYINSFDLSNPSNFFIKDFNNDGLPDMYLHIYAYNDEDFEIPAKTKRQYHIKTNRIFISFKDGKMKCFDWKE